MLYLLLLCFSFQFLLLFPIFKTDIAVPRLFLHQSAFPVRRFRIRHSGIPDIRSAATGDGRTYLSSRSGSHSSGFRDIYPVRPYPQTVSLLFRHLLGTCCNANIYIRKYFVISKLPPPHAKYTTYCTNLWGPTENAHAVTNRTGRHLFARIVLSRHTIVRRSQFLFLSDSSTSHSVRTYPCRQGRSRHGQPAGPTRLSRAYHARQCGLPEMDRAARSPVVETQNSIMPC